MTEKNKTVQEKLL